MAIGKISRGSGFSGVLSYLLDPAKKPRIISGCVAHEEPLALAREFRLVANLRRRVKKPVRHFSISFAPEDGVVDDITKEAIAFRVLDGLGYEDCQFIAIAHDRNDPGHDEVHEHDHMHIVTNAVTLDGEYVHDSFDRYRIQPILREVEQEFGLRRIASSWAVKREKAQAVHLDSDLAQLIGASLKDAPDLKTWLDRLDEVNIDVRFNLSKNDNVMGITYLKDGEIHKGKDIGASWQSVSEKLTATADALPLMKAANLKSQEKPVQLNQIDRAMCDRVVEMAVMKLGQGKQFKNSRADIKLEGDTLTVIRIRPHKLMVKATQTKDGWEPVGFPNIQKKDVELLERMNGVEAKKFNDGVEQPDSQPEMPIPVTRKSKPPRTTQSLRQGMSI